MSSQKHRVVVVGGGVEALRSAFILAHDSMYEVTLISESAEFEYRSSLVRDTGGVSKNHIRVAFEDIFSKRSRDLDLVRAKIKRIDADKNRVITTAGVDYRYDSLIMALEPELLERIRISEEDTVYSAYSSRDVEEFRRKVIVQFENGQAQRKYVVVGGGETGVRLAGELRQLVNALAKKHGQDPYKINVVLLEANKRILAEHAKHVSARVEKRLKRIGVSVKTSAPLKKYSNQILSLRTGQEIEAELVLMAHGSGANKTYFENRDVFLMTRSGFVRVTSLLEAEGHNHIYVLGTSADSIDTKDTDELLYEADYVCDILHRKKYGKELAEFTPPTRTLVLQVGAWWAIVVGNHTYSGILGYLYKRWIDLKHFSTLLPKRLALKVWMKGSRHELID